MLFKRWREQAGHAPAKFAQRERTLSEKLHCICFSQVPTGSDYPACPLPSKKQGECKENPPFSMPFFHEIKIRQNAYCILGKPENGILRTLDGSTPEVREQKSHCVLSIFRNTTAFHFYCILISFTRVTTILWQCPIHFALSSRRARPVASRRIGENRGNLSPWVLSFCLVKA